MVGTNAKDHTMKNILVSLFTVGFIFSFSSSLLAIEAAKEKSTKKELPEMRHGWNVVTGPSRTIEGVNDQQTIERGKLVFKMNCVACHGKNGEGDGPLAKEFNIHPANLKKMANKLGNHYMVVQINKGKGDMPEWRDLLTQSQIWDLTSYIQTLNDDSAH